MVLCWVASRARTIRPPPLLQRYLVRGMHRSFSRQYLDPGRQYRQYGFPTYRKDVVTIVFRVTANRRGWPSLSKRIDWLFAILQPFT
ncbi:hypothetical protein IAQ61_003826 [Plenodomus lingam]|uniref:uncharacterized protein n=1 Tax=Leptosphaeria maculans TaxID=5022 RepID=UPI003333A2B4|nr:hypothetical protein IAQ61_003826 [Plenodomus lingam]